MNLTNIPPLPGAGHSRVTGLSGNEIYCLNLLGMKPGNLCVGNSVFSLGVLGSITSGLKNLGGGEIPEITGLIHEGRSKAFSRMCAEAEQHGGLGITVQAASLSITATTSNFFPSGP